jgi:hypothetical protein
MEINKSMPTKQIFAFIFLAALMLSATLAQKDFADGSYGYTLAASDTTQPEDAPLKKDKRRDSVLIPNFTSAEVMSEFAQLRYDTLQWDMSITDVSPGRQQALREAERRKRRQLPLFDANYYSTMEKRLNELGEVRHKAGWLMRYMEWQGAERNDPDMVKIGKMASEIMKNHGLLKADLLTVAEQKGEEAAVLLKKVEKDLLRKEADEIMEFVQLEEGKTTIQKLKEGIFMSKLPSNINCKSGVGYWLKGLAPSAWEGIDPKAGCLGYMISMGKEHNLVILRVQMIDENTGKDKVIAILWDKIADDGFSGAVMML